MVGKWGTTVRYSTHFVVLQRVMLKHHLNGGVRKGAFSAEEAEKKFEAWLQEKEAKIQAKVDGLSNAEAES